MGTASVRIEGGFVGIASQELLRVWQACMDGRPGIGGFRAWLACREMVARRQGVGRDRAPVFDVAELARLLDVSARTAAASVRRLVDAGLLEWSESAIGFPALLHDPVGQLSDTIGKGEGMVTIPRRLLRFLARAARPAIIATALGALLRCLSRRRSGFGTRGRFKASWVANLFGIAERHARAARAELVALGWLEPEPDDRQWAWNRWGRAFRVRLDWAGPGDDRPTLPADPGARSSCPESDPEPLREGLNPEPAVDARTGASLGQEDGKLSAPDLRDVRPEDLVETARTLELHRQAVERGAITASERDRVRFVAAVEHARVVGRANPPGLLARIVGRGWWHLITQGDEDRAARRLREHDRPAPAPTLASRPSRSSAVYAPAHAPATPIIRSPYAQERPTREPSALGDLLARLASGPGSIPG
jgi:hypothetical protein